MDAHTFDRWTAALAHRPSRRSAARLLVGGLISGVLVQRRIALTGAAQREDRDQDGLFDDDETDVYGTDPDVFDSDGDGVGDGEEIYNRDQGLGGPSDPLNPAGGIEPPPPEQCVAVGGPCNSDAECCSGGTVARCCFNGVSLTTRCTDVTTIGLVCPGEPAGPVACPAGLTDCGGACVDLASHAGHCGACFQSCPLGGVCRGSVCGGTVILCAAGLTDCFGVCVDLEIDLDNCGGCGVVCGPHDGCFGGGCLAPPAGG